MKLRHAAALALTGWYLMVPPYDLEKGLVDDAAPLSKWTIDGSFDSAEQCKAAIRAHLALVRQAYKDFEKSDQEQRGLAKSGDPAAQQWMRDDAKAKPARSLTYTGTLTQHDPDIVPSLCIATDDPRLKETRPSFWPW
jgi:hypothetical protein